MVVSQNTSYHFHESPHHRGSIAPPGSGSYIAKENRVLVKVKTEGLQDGLVMFADWAEELM